MMAKRRAIYPFEGAQFIGGGVRTVLQPVLPVIIYGPDGSRGVAVKSALVDTGADFCTCPSKITKPIGHKLRSGKPVKFHGAVAMGKAWQHEVEIAILRPDYRGTFHKLPNVPLHLVQKRKPFPILLGREQFKDQFFISFDFINKLLILELL